MRCSGVVSGFSAHLPHAHVGHRGRKRFAEEFAHLVGVRADLCEVIDEQQHGRQRKHTGKQTQVAKLHQELNVLCKQALRHVKKLSHSAEVYIHLYVVLNFSEHCRSVKINFVLMLKVGITLVSHWINR